MYEEYGKAVKKLVKKTGEYIDKDGMRYQGYRQIKKAITSANSSSTGFSTQTTLNRIKEAGQKTLRTMGKMGFNVSPESFKPKPYVSLNVFKPSAPIKVNKDFKHEQFMKGMITQKRGSK